MTRSLSSLDNVEFDDSMRRQSTTEKDASEVATPRKLTQFPMKKSWSEGRLSHAHLYTKRLSMVVVDRIKMPDMGSYHRETKHFSETTTMHGPKRIYQGKRLSFVFWLIIVSISIGGLSSQVYNLVVDYASNPTISEMLYVTNHSGLLFPAVTICNFNAVKKSEFHKLNKTENISMLLLDYFLASNLEPPTLHEDMLKLLMNGEHAFEEYKQQRNLTDYDFMHFLYEVGFDCPDIFKICTFGGKEFNCCDSIEPVNTNMGKCFKLDIKTLNRVGFTKQRAAGYTAGLQIILDTHTEEQLYGTEEVGVFNPSFETGFRYYVHDANKVPYLASEGISISPGKRVYSAISMAEYELLGSSEGGTCRNQWPEELSTVNGINTTMVYTENTCESMFKASLFNTHCGCSPASYNIDSKYKACTPLATLTCMKTLVQLREEQNLETNHTNEYFIPINKECRTECFKTIYQSFNSYGEEMNPAAVNWLNNKNSSWTKERIKTNFLAINVFFRDLSYTTYIQKPATDLVTLLSNIGGNMGMFLGMSVITITEISLFFTKLFWIAVSKRRRWYMTQKKQQEETKRRQLEQSVQVLNQFRDGGHSPAVSFVIPELHIAEEIQGYDNDYLDVPAKI